MYPLGMTPQDPLIFALCIVVIFWNGPHLTEYLSQEQIGALVWNWQRWLSKHPHFF